MALDVTTETFDQEVIQSDKPVLVDFWAEWCGPCHAVAPVLDRIASEREDELKLVKVNIDEEHELAQRFGVASIPTMILFKDGEPSAAVVGAQPKGAIERSARARRQRKPLRPTLRILERPSRRPGLVVRLGQFAARPSGAARQAIESLRDASSKASSSRRRELVAARTSASSATSSAATGSPSTTCDARSRGSASRPRRARRRRCPPRSPTKTRPARRRGPSPRASSRRSPSDGLPRPPRGSRPARPTARGRARPRGGRGGRGPAASSTSAQTHGAEFA